MKRRFSSSAFTTAPEPDGGSVLNEICGDEFEAQSAASSQANSIRRGRSDGGGGIDISQKRNQAVFDVWKSGQLFAYVVPSVMSRVRKSVRSFPVRDAPALGLSRSFRPDRDARKKLARCAKFATRSGENRSVVRRSLRRFREVNPVPIRLATVADAEAINAIITTTSVRPRRPSKWTMRRRRNGSRNCAPA